jgi:AraC family transcriptional regulator
MICNCCIRVLKMEFENAGIEVVDIKLGEATISYNQGEINNDRIKHLLVENGFELIENKNDKLVADLKHAVVDLVHHTTFNAMVRNSDFLVGKFDKSYQYLSTVFSESEGITLEKYIILHRIEKAKVLIQEDNLSLSEIAYMMGYSSVQYLSTQFKSITGISVTDFKKSPAEYRKSIDEF